MLTFGNKLVSFIGMHCSEEYFEDPQLKAFYEDIMQRYQNGEEISVEAYSRREHPYPELVGEIVLERYWISELGMKKRGYNIHKDADPFKTARGALKTIRIRFLEQLHQRLLDDYPYADTDRKAQIQEWIRKARRERNRFETVASETLFPAES